MDTNRKPSNKGKVIYFS